MISFLSTFGLALALVAIFVFTVSRTKESLSFQLVVVSIPILFLWEAPNDTLLAKVSGNSIYYLDVLCVYLVAINLSRASTRSRKSPAAIWVLLGLSILISVGAGFLQTNYNTVVVEARSLITASIVFAWALSVEWSKHNTKIVRIWSTWFSVALILVAAYHFLRYGLGNADDLVAVGAETKQTSRILTSQQAESLVLALLINVNFSKSKSKWTLLGFGVIVLLLAQQRTVWVTCITVLVVALVSSRFRTRLAGWSFATAGFGIALLSFGSSTVSQSLFISISSQGTLGARSDSWLQLVQPVFDKGILPALFGSPFGSGFLRYLTSGSYATYNPHDFYVFLFLRVGLIGLAFYVTALTMLLMRAFRERAEMSTLITAAVIAYGFSYNVDFELALFLGFALTYANSFLSFNSNNSRRPVTRLDPKVAS